MIRIGQLEFRYREGEFRLLIPELSIAAGSRAAIIGPSGSGKTTLLNLVAGVALPDRGRVEVGDVDVNGIYQAAAEDPNFGWFASLECWRDTPFGEGW